MSVVFQTLDLLLSVPRFGEYSSVGKQSANLTLIRLLLLASLAVLVVLPPTATATAPNIPVSVSLELSNVPVLGQKATITARIVSAMPARDASANITMSDHMQLVSGVLSWHGTLSPQVETQVIVVVKAVATGSAWITAIAGFPVSGGYFHDTDTLYLDIGIDHSEMSHSTALTSTTNLVQAQTVQHTSELESTWVTGISAPSTTALVQAQTIQKASEFRSNWLVVVPVLLVAVLLIAVLDYRKRTQQPAVASRENVRRTRISRREKS
jgi:hypothetical protein